MKHRLRYIPPAALIAFGWYAEITWYYVRFTADGNAPILSAAQGIALTLFLSVAVVLPKSWWKTALIVSLVAYSVMATTSGQAYNLDLVRIANTEEQTEAQQAQRQITRFESLITDKLAEIERLNAIKREQTTSIADQSLWRTALANLNEDIAELEDDVRTLEAQKLAIISVGSIKPDDIYTRYSKLTGIPVTVIESIFQLALSAAIALMAPVGIFIWPRQREQKVEVKDTPATIERSRLVDFVKSINHLEYLPIWEKSGLTRDEYKTAVRILTKVGAVSGVGKRWKKTLTTTEILEKIAEYKTTT